MKDYQPDWKKGKPIRMNSLSDLAILIPKEVIEEDRKIKAEKYKKALFKVSPGKSGKKTPKGYRAAPYKPNSIPKPQINFEGEGNYRKLIYNRPKS
ncbi:hypothetical protein [Pedobacter psychrodurus]|jgi:hypothetical protein|uniref:hypothetical protein n=1 Tax=Pedobacter psychrodurus TaxID=2530456 RepID=UPI00292E8C0E|nr:hypothetical protein [Pedobacter psychrodurus]